MHRRQGNFEKAIQEFNEATSLDPRNPMTELPNTLSMMREFSAAERTFDRAIALAPDHPILKVLKAYLVTDQKSGSVVAMQAALAELPESMANDRDVLTWHLFCALNERDWQQATAFVDGDRSTVVGNSGRMISSGILSLSDLSLRLFPLELEN